MAEEIAEIGRLLVERLDVEAPRNLRAQLSVLDSWRARTYAMLREEEKRLNEMNSLNLLPKDKGITELDRETHLKFKNRDQLFIVDTLKDLADCLDDKISLGQSFLSGLREEVKKGI